MANDLEMILRSIYRTKEIVEKSKNSFVAQINTTQAKYVVKMLKNFVVQTSQRLSIKSKMFRSPSSSSAPKISSVSSSTTKSGSIESGSTSAGTT